MREILFRAKTEPNCKDVLTGKIVKKPKWVHGYVDLGYMHDCKHAIISEERGNTAYRCQYETIGQYAGMPDKNGVKIFEGDIVRDNDGTIYPVVWGGTGFYLKYDPPHAHGLHYDLLPLCNYWHAQGAIIEVIGNIHDNPDLLNGGEDNAVT